MARAALVAAGTFLAAAVIPGGIFFASAVRGQTVESTIPENASAMAEAPVITADEMPVRANPDYRWRYRASRFRWDIGRDTSAAGVDGRWVRVPDASPRGAVVPAQLVAPQPEPVTARVAAAPADLSTEIGLAAPASMIDAPTARPPALPRVASLSDTTDSSALYSAPPPPRIDDGKRVAALPAAVAPVAGAEPQREAPAAPAAPAPVAEPVVPKTDPSAGTTTAALPADAVRNDPGDPGAPAGGVGGMPEAGDDARVGALSPAFKDAPLPLSRPDASVPVRIQVGVFGVPSNATRMLARLQEAGFVARSVPVTMGGRSLTSVIAGPFDNAGEFARAMDLIQSYGITDAYAFYR
ncbi:SPOR domain-containing protein [Limibaculum sp. M0105]|uniref:SPOR domain-containing protein n=1 Tax=Thermohalobaculum xanthum TaxID=2753746 RepID=A0A8J7SE30_9RHOB|nr:SPOR domain-containing protein [Thermohalobaculum xanthum]MBK0398742.1 SPOR domain-containing protein [Thermohalobaculum xanthum]